MEKVKKDPNWISNHKKHNDSQGTRVITPDGEFKSFNEAAKFYKISSAAFYDRRKRYPNLYYVKYD